MSRVVVAEEIRVTGIVQGVGFRPTVWRLAKECGLTGEVWNDAEGVMVKGYAEQSELDLFVRRLRDEQPPLAAIEEIFRTPLGEVVETPDDFRIVTSREGDVHTGVAADAATCPECLAEVMDPDNRRYRYPFTNCTHCGPRLSIIRAIPYDRPNTSMVKFPMCEPCQSEYEDPADRRFHAQPNACGECGPRVWLETADGSTVEPDNDCDAVETAARLIRRGEIVAVKGIGGIHLACDATNELAVNLLRRRKHRYHKALALMARDLEMVRRFVHPTVTDIEQIQNRAAPIVVMEMDGEQVAKGVAPGQNTLGFMLPYTPLHHLLMRHMEHPIVLTSGNRSDEPQTINNDDAHRRLDRIADYYLLHDRDIVNRVDDSVVRTMADKPRFLRRARGYAPRPVLLGEGLSSSDNILAMGGELKNTFCLLQQGRAVLSQHMGDLEDVATYRDYLHNLELYRNLYDFEPDLIVVDKHPNYLSTQYGRQLAAETGVKLIEVQHHHAHIASVIAEHGRQPDAGKVLGIALDGLGFGEDGTIWGGEFLLADYFGFERLAWFEPAPMLGGAKAMEEPWRNTLAHLFNTPGWQQVVDNYGELDLVRYLQGKPLETLRTMAEKGLNSPMASSAGRLFDAVAAALDVCREKAGFEGQAAIELEALASPFMERESDRAYGYEFKDQCLSWKPLWQGVLDDLKTGTERGVIAVRFHLAVASAVATTAIELCSQYGLSTVAVSGGVFQNRLLLEKTVNLLAESDLEVLIPEAVPMNDGGLSLGQAAIGVAHLKGGQYQASSKCLLESF